MVRTENLTLLLSDIVGFTERTARQSRLESDRLRRAHEDLLPPLATRFAGRVVKSMGDAFLITFRSPTDAVRCAMAFQDAVTDFNRSRPPDQQFQIRVALNVGEVRIASDDVHGEAVNVTARIEELTPPSQIYLSEALYLVMNRVEVKAEIIGEHTLRGIPEPVQIYRVPPKSDGGADGFPFGGMHLRPEESGSSPPSRTRSVLLGVVAGAAIAAGIAGWWIWDREDASEGDKIESVSPASENRSPPILATTQQPAPESTAELSQPESVAPLPIERPKESAPAPSKPKIADDSGSAGDSKAVDRSSSPVPVEDLDSAEGLLLKGHLAFENADRRSGVDFYRQALGADAALKSNKQLVDNLVQSLGWVGKPAAEMLRLHSSPQSLSALAARSGQPGIHGRHRAVSLLEDMGYGDRVDRLGNAILDLSEEPECSQRRDAVRRLRELGDKRALPALQESVALQKDTLRNACLLLDAQTAIWTLKGGGGSRNEDRP